MTSSPELERKIAYCATPSRFAERKDEICKFVVDKIYLPFHPFHAFPYEFYEGHPEVGRRPAMKICLDSVKNCDEFWIFGISAGTLEELVYAIEKGKKVRLFMDDFDPEWEKFYEDLGPECGDPLRMLSSLTTIEEICRGYEEWMKTDSVLSCSVFDPSAEKITSKFNCGKEQIREFSKILHKYKNLRADYENMAGNHEGIKTLASFYLNDLTRASKETEFIFDFRQANKKGIFLDWCVLS